MASHSYIMEFEARVIRANEQLKNLRPHAAEDTVDQLLSALAIECGGNEGRGLPENANLWATALVNINALEKLANRIGQHLTVIRDKCLRLKTYAAAHGVNTGD